MTYRAVPCPCDHASCPDWHVSPVAAVLGVGFTREQAEEIAHLLNGTSVIVPFGEEEHAETTINEIADKCGYACYRFRDGSLEDAEDQPGQLE